MSQPQTPTVIPVVLPPNVVKRLTLARYQLLRARLQLSVATEFNAWQASLVLHDAADICLLSIADHRGIQRGTKSKPVFLQQYPGLLEKRTSQPFYDAAAIEDVVEVRNPAKHRGGFPSFTDVRALAERVGLALDRNCEIYLGIPLSAVSLADMIEDLDVRTLVKTAEIHTQQAKYADAAISLKHAWLLAMSRFRDRFVGYGLPSLRISLREHGRSAAGSKTLEAVEAWWERLRPTLELLVLGVDLTRYAAFEGSTPIVHLTDADRPVVYLAGEGRVLYTPETVQFCLSFVLDTIVRLQEVERIPQRGSYYTIRLTSETECLDATDSQYNGAGRLAKGQLIEGARVALGPGTGDSWTWRDPQTKRTYLIPVEAAEVVRVVTGAEYARTMAEDKGKE